MREPTNDEQRLMIIGGFEHLEDSLAWLNKPSTEEELLACEEPDWEEIALRELGCFESGRGEDNDPDILAAMLERAEIWLEDKAKLDARKQAD